ncbi:MAG: hypothetical protein AB9882_11820 [Ignavibacteriaceae bacterium]
MPEGNTIKGLQSVKTMGGVKKSCIPDKNADFIKLYMFEKERERLSKERGRILLRLEVLDNRLKEIQDFYNKKTGYAANPAQGGTKKKKKESEKPKWRTMSIDY